MAHGRAGTRGADLLAMQGRLQPGPAVDSIREDLAQGANSEELSGMTLFWAVSEERAV